MNSSELRLFSRTQRVLENLSGKKLKEKLFVHKILLRQQAHNGRQQQLAVWISLAFLAQGH